MKPLSTTLLYLILLITLLAVGSGVYSAMSSAVKVREEKVSKMRVTL